MGKPRNIIARERRHRVVVLVDAEALLHIRDGQKPGSDERPEHTGIPKGSVFQIRMHLLTGDWARPFREHSEGSTCQIGYGHVARGSSVGKLKVWRCVTTMSASARKYTGSSRRRERSPSSKKSKDPW